MKEMICICCPMGCRLKVYDEESPIRVEGNTCPRGAKYGAEEAVCPKRVVTSVVRVKGGEIAMVSVNYFLYQAILKARKKKYADRILKMSAGLLNE